jgi:hypothetical protein
MFGIHSTKVSRLDIHQLSNNFTSNIRTIQAKAHLIVIATQHSSISSRYRTVCDMQVVTSMFVAYRQYEQQLNHISIIL